MAKTTRKANQCLDWQCGDDGTPLFAGTFSTVKNGAGYVVVTTNTPILAANPDRRYAEIFNNSGYTIYLALGADAVGAGGVTVPTGSSYVIGPGNLFTGAVNGYSADGVPVTFVEA